MNRMLAFLDRFSDGRRAAQLFALTLAALVSINFLDFPGSVPYMRRVSGQTYLDMQGFYTAARAYQLLDAFGPQGRRLQLVLSTTFDAVFPSLVGAFGAVAITWLFRRAFGRPSRLAALAVAAAALDYLENLALIVLVTEYPRRLDLVAQAAGVFTALKGVAYLAATVVLLVGVVFALGRPRPLHPRVSGVPDPRGLSARLPKPRGASRSSPRPDSSCTT
jgi:hypothetical protein